MLVVDYLLSLSWQDFYRFFFLAQLIEERRVLEVKYVANRYLLLAPAPNLFPTCISSSHFYFEIILL